MEIGLGFVSGVRRGDDDDESMILIPNCYSSGEYCGFNKKSKEYRVSPQFLELNKRRGVKGAFHCLHINENVKVLTRRAKDRYS
ncbi:hypothetical protein CARUB_v10011279mg [Capsella rubella]|uniref:Uncharacterized protein n=1 Tax=Capsella rubella TaxID=81985 RepID=R0IP11_9BRAS|nr:hypothetical protein CARUB_v10011279mg [Capsella rubella]